MILVLFVSNFYNIFQNIELLINIIIPLSFLQSKYLKFNHIQLDEKI